MCLTAFFLQAHTHTDGTVYATAVSLYLYVCIYDASLDIWNVILSMDSSFTGRARTRKLFATFRSATLAQVVFFSPDTQALTRES